MGPPNEHGGGPVPVRVSFHLRDINEIDDAAETFEFEGILSLRWKDERQAFDPDKLGVAEKVYQGDFQFDEVFAGWFPQLVLVNESGLHERRGRLLRVQPDGSMTSVETMNATAEADLRLERYPFDRQGLDIVFEVLGFSADEVVLELDPETGGVTSASPKTPQWTIEGTSASTRNREVSYVGSGDRASVFVVSVDARRESFFMIRLVVIPLMIIVMLSWSVFWMDRSSLGDRLNVSFVGILTAVAYQIVVSEIWPDISYFTLMHGFLNLSMLIMAATVVINLRVGRLDQQGRPQVGDQLDRRCRWIFPLIYFGLLLVMVAVAFAFF